MHDNKPLIAILIGAISTIPYEIFTRILIAFGFGKFSVFELSSLIVTLNRPTAIMGFVTTSLVGGISALIFYSLLQRLSLDYIIIKGFVGGLLTWIITEVFYTWLIEGPKLIQARPVSDYYLQMFGSAIFGISMGILFKKYLILDRTKV